jgi:hypothetical protein
LGDPVAESAPQINDLAAIPVDSESGADLLAAAQVATEGVATFPYPPSTSPPMRSGETFTFETIFCSVALGIGDSRCYPACSGDGICAAIDRRPKRRITPQLPRAALRGTTRKRRVAVDTASNVYVTDGNHNRVLKFPAG